MPRKALDDGDCYAGRSQDAVPVNFSLDREAYNFLLMMTTSRKRFGMILSRLLLEERARMQQRIAMQEALKRECGVFLEESEAWWVREEESDEMPLSSELATAG